MTRFMLDTNTISHLLKQHPGVVRQVVAATMPSLCISAITEAELQFGLAKRPDKKQVHNAVGEFLRCVDVLPWDSLVAHQYGQLRAKLEQLGKPLGPLDMLIAAHALCAKAVLVTNDQAFRLVENLRVEDWTA